jgi:hypothetical protein
MFVTNRVSDQLHEWHSINISPDICYFPQFTWKGRPMILSKNLTLLRALASRNDSHAEMCTNSTASGINSKMGIVPFCGVNHLPRMKRRCVNWGHVGISSQLKAHGNYDTVVVSSSYCTVANWIQWPMSIFCQPSVSREQAWWVRWFLW